MGGNSSSQRRAAAPPAATVPKSAPKSKFSEANVIQLIANGKLAPIDKHDGSGETSGCECPICFVDYVCVNHVVCCKNTICSDCFIELHRKIASPQVNCPFCGTDKFTIKYSGSQPTHSGSSSEKLGSPERHTDTNKQKPPEKQSSPALVFASVDARKELEAEMQAHRQLAGDYQDVRIIDEQMRDRQGRGSDAMRRRMAQRDAARRRIASRHVAPPESSEDENEDDFSSAVFAGMRQSRQEEQSRDSSRASALRRIEEELLLEAIRLSLEESKAAPTTAKATTPPPGKVDMSSMEDGDDDLLELEMALALSLSANCKAPPDDETKIAAASDTLSASSEALKHAATTASLPPVIHDDMDTKCTILTEDSIHVDEIELCDGNVDVTRLESESSFFAESGQILVDRIENVLKKSTADTAESNSPP